MRLHLAFPLAIALLFVVVTGCAAFKQPMPMSENAETAHSHWHSAAESPTTQPGA